MRTVVTDALDELPQFRHAVLLPERLPDQRARQYAIPNEEAAPTM
jgi:hypothetical protein